MDEATAIACVKNGFGQEVYARLAQYVAMLHDGALKQNLIARSTFDQIWARHILDSVQLLDHAPDEGDWLDVGAGAGLPGVPVAIAGHHRTTMIEPRRLRVDFVTDCIAGLALDTKARIVKARVEKVVLDRPAAVISARAVAPLPELFAAAHHLARNDTIWLLPKGRTAQSEVANARRSWHGVFHVKQSVVDPASEIVVAHGVHPR